MNTTIRTELQARSNGDCELCNNETATVAYAVSPRNHDDIANEVALCPTCLAALEATDASLHWQCLAGSIWNSEPSVQALSYRILSRYKEEQWAGEILDSVVPDDAVINWALSAFEVAAVHKDSNGNELANGDTVVLTQVLNVKGANFMAPKGTIVRKIRLVPDNAEQIEGKVNEQTIVILTKYVRKSS